MLKQFLLFVCEVYYPAGGMEDFEGDFDTLEEAMIKAKEMESEYNFSHIFDQNEKKIIWEGYDED